MKWPPPSDGPKKVRGIQQNRDGDRTLIPLRRQPYDQAIRGHYENTCCKCGLTHLITVEVFVEKRGQFWMSKRTYRLGAKR